jgi:hypothetical protein
MSNRDEQPFHFCCQTCGSPIDIILRKDCGGDFVGAHQLVHDLYPFDDNFVDLHLDFPVSFEKYVMGHLSPLNPIHIVFSYGYEATRIYN